jgi:hypothetical protein
MKAPQPPSGGLLQHDGLACEAVRREVLELRLRKTKKSDTQFERRLLEGACDAILSRRLYIEPTVIEAGALEPRWNAVEDARARGINVPSSNVYVL